MARDAFLHRPRTPASTSAGDVELPVLYGDASAVVAYFRVDHARATEVLARTPLEPARFAGGKAIAGFVAYDYGNTSLGPHREVAAVVAVVPRGVAAPASPLLHLLREQAHDDVGWHVLDLPVTTAAADVAGREIWGLPRFVTGIDVALERDDVRVDVWAPSGDGAIATLEGRLGACVGLGAMDLVLYTERGGALFRTVLETNGRMRTGLGRGLALRVPGAEHPMARRLRALGLDGARPAAVQACAGYRAVLGAPLPFPAAAARGAPRLRRTPGAGAPPRPTSSSRGSWTG